MYKGEPNPRLWQTGFADTQHLALDLARVFMRGLKGLENRVQVKQTGLSQV
ncbi:hypothetical protein JG687_00012240 [Phytophthora cactorum]|uniref:Uncharacterized protein n=1 Tax=Phytophthora cactorum TaxID=29920 RepID=A0A329S495_9STRA|nr:hypothetical protein PC119_g17543 [Phytophthora cactorum]KAG3088549.1 hypothetical protein PC121_g4446 [Phytophthora cactorum]KAG3155413.1 hypothetical protein PC128_g22082 [Phytophthora cactorum]KAG3166535.1 hypothetical protein C6341_g12030 [Phytophthora cactorum]KAG4038707.1 hypothetical protein PC123_g25732 [Phytophthora cactorum]